MKRENVATFVRVMSGVVEIVALETFG